MYDNQRLFAQNNWRQNGGAHDAVRFILKNKKIEGDLIGAFNQEQGAQERFFETDFSPGFNNYKVLLANFIKYKTDKFTLTGINVADAFQDAQNIRTTHWRYTSGGRIEFTKNRWYTTLAGYYQYGNTSKGTKLSAWYLQPEAQYKDNKHWTIRLGAEVFSGDNGLRPDNTSQSFDALYGVNHRFLGSMDYFTRFPGDLNNAGLVAPYLFIFYDVNKKMTLRADGHLFSSQNNFVPDGALAAIDKYLGFENDLLIRYRPNTYTEIDLGYSWASLSESMEYIKKGGNSSLFQSWAFLMITFNPEIFHWTNTQ